MRFRGGKHPRTTLDGHTRRDRTRRFHEISKIHQIQDQSTLIITGIMTHPYIYECVNIDYILTVYWDADSMKFMISTVPNTTARAL